VRRHLLDLSILFVFSTVVSGYILLSQPGLRNITIHVYVLIVGALLMLGVVTNVGDNVPRRLRTELDAALAASKRPNKTLPELAKLEREVGLATTSAYDLHYRLLPSLREIAQAQLARTGRSADEQTLGRWWELLRPDRPAPQDRFAGGIREADLRALVADLARM
jgi:hypothetical protein